MIGKEYENIVVKYTDEIIETFNNVINYEENADGSVEFDTISYSGIVTATTHIILKEEVKILALIERTILTRDE